MTENTDIEVTPDETAIEKVEQVASPMSIQDGMSLLPVEQQETLLAEYDKRRDFFLAWLKGHLKEGIHYGFPPGCSPRSGVDESQWKAKPSLYKAGALLMVDLLKIKPKYSPDKDAWEQFGSKPGLIVMKCELLQHGAIMGEGRGSYAVGEKSGMKENATIKMAEKRALVDAVISSIPVVGDLFTQDEPPRPVDKMTLDERKGLLADKVKAKTDASQWPKSPSAFIHEVVISETGQAFINSIGAINAIEKALFTDGCYDWDTAERIPDHVGRDP